MKSLLLLVFLGPLSAGAAPSKEASKKPETTVSAAKVSTTRQTEATTHNFEDLLVQGKYHFSDEAVTTVEEDKVLDSLIGVRSDFKDRLKSSMGSY